MQDPDRRTHRSPEVHDLANEHAIYCPLCGNKVPPGLTRCPVCATELQRVISKRASETTVPGAADFLRKDIPSTRLPQAKPECPQCGLALEGGESKCPRCGVPLSAEESMKECPECGALSPTDAKSCSRCGSGFRKERRPPMPTAPSRPVAPVATKKVPVPEPSKPEPIVEKVTPPPVRAEAAPPSEVVPISVQTRPSSQGITNGRGAVNGTGLTNGAGVTNGTRAEARAAPARSRSKSLMTRWQFLALLVVLIVVIPTFMFLSYSKDSEPIKIDGEFSDWADVAKYKMFRNSASDASNVTEWAVKLGSSNLFVFVSTKAATMSTAEIDSFYLFADSDGSSSTGYIVSDIGADYMVEIHGWNGSITSSPLSRFPLTAERDDWNSWQNMGSASAVLAANRIEWVADVPVISAGARYVLASQSGQSQQGISYPVREDITLLVVKQQPIPAVAATGIVAKGPSVGAMRLTLSCQGGSGMVTSIVPTVSGATPIIPQTGTISMTVGQEQTVDVMIDTSGWTDGSVASVFLAQTGVTSSFDTVLVVGEPVRAYINTAPSSIQIDGAFADWSGRTAADSDLTAMKDSNVDISAVGAVNTSVSSSFYISVKGDMCGGSFVPSQTTKPSGSGGGVVTPTKKTGEDFLRVFLDTDLLASTGSVVMHPSKTIGADYLIEVTGVNQKITSKSIQEFVSGSWIFVSGTVTAENDDQQLELGVSSSSISGVSSIEFVIEMTDWRGWSDIATSVPQGTRAADMPGTRAWIVDNTINSAESTATSNQRKLFYDGVNFWSVYVDGTDTIARHSADGMTWTSDGRIFNANGVVRTSIWYDSTSNMVYAVGDRTAATVNAYVQRGMVSPSTHTITWSAADKVLVVSSFAAGTKNTYISRDASGYIWLMSVNCTSITPTRYDLSVFKSSVAGDIAGTWALTGSMLVSIPQTTLKGSIVPAGTGSDMWAVYVYAGTVASRKYTGTWSSESILYAATALGGNTEYAPPSALVDTRGVLHVVYGNDHEQPVGTSKPHIYYRYNTGSSWSGAVALSSIAANDGFKYPTISLDASTGNLYAFWYDMQTQYVTAKRNVSGTWSAITLNAQTTNPKAHLTSIYSAPDAGFICYQWTQNTTAPYHVIFDRIPEFSDVALPALGMMAILVLVVGPLRKRRQSD